MSRRFLSIACVAGLFASSFANAQVAPKPRTPAQIEAERILIQARCSLHNEESKFQLKRGEVTLTDMGGPVDHVAFPIDTKDADLAKLLPYVAKLPNLKSLQLSNCDLITEKGLKSLKILPKVEVLLLDSTLISAAGLKELVNVKGMRFLDLSATPLTDQDMKLIGTLPTVSSLVVQNMPKLTEDGIKNILELNKIRYLDITIEKSPDKMAEALSTAKFLASLKVSPITDSEATHLGRMSRLDTLDLSNESPFDVNRLNRMPNFNDLNPPKKGNGAANPVIRQRPVNTISDRGMNKLVGCTELRSLDLSYVRVSGGGLDEFTKIKRLEELYFRGTNFTDGGVAKLATMSTLRVIDLRDTSVSDRAMEDLADLPTLQRLYLAGCPISDSGLQDLTRLRSLQVLDLSSTNVSCVRVRDMKNFTQLEHLHLAGSRVTTSSFYVLGSIKSLRFLNLLDNLPEVGIPSLPPLKAELPSCLIIASEPRPPGFGFGTPFFVGWPGAAYYAFRVPEIKETTTPKPIITPMFTPPVTIKQPPPMTVKAPPPKPPAPPPIRVVPLGGGGSGRP